MSSILISFSAFLISIVGSLVDSDNRHKYLHGLIDGAIFGIFIASCVLWWEGVIK